MIDRNTLLLLALMFAAGWWASPPAPTPGPAGRPVMRWIAGAARKLLWVAVFVEPAPPAPQQRYVHSRVDAEGIPALDNGATL